MTVVETTDVQSGEMKVLLDRMSAGFTVEVGVIPTTGEVILEGRTESYRARVPILPEQALTAFTHPCAFLPYPDRFFRALKADEAADETALPKNGTVVTVERRPLDDYCAACERSLLAHEAGPYCDTCGDS